MVEYENVEGLDFDFKEGVVTLEIGKEKKRVKNIKVISFIGKDWHVNVGPAGINAEIFKKARCEVVDVIDGAPGLICWVEE